VGEKVTVHQLLSHTSGIPSYTGLPGFFTNVSRNPYSVDEFVKKYASNDLEFEPGSKFSYNNSGYFLLGAIIEKVTGKEAIIEQLPDQPGDVPKTFADISKAKKLLGYAPGTRFNEGLDKFYDWFSQHEDLLLK
jgi:hypothetical protein